MRFEWDEEKRAVNLKKHGIDFADVWRVFENEIDVIIDDRFDYGETRYSCSACCSVEWLQFHIRKRMKLEESFPSEKVIKMTKKNTLETSQTDWARIDAMSDDDIDYSDIPPFTEEMFARGVLMKNGKPVPRKHQENLPIDRDLIEFFKSQDFNYPAKINQLLREYMEAHQAK